MLDVYIFVLMMPGHTNIKFRTFLIEVVNNDNFDFMFSDLHLFHYVYTSYVHRAVEFISHLCNKFLPNPSLLLSTVCLLCHWYNTSVQECICTVELVEVLIHCSFFSFG